MLLAVFLVALAGCDRIPGLDGGGEAIAADTTAPATEAVEVPPSDPLPERIYFTLTDYDWYARGEPLVLENAQYRAGRGVVGAPLSAMRKVGEYQGVDVYAADGEAADTAVYVPVFPGYWQPFHLSEAAAPAASGS